MLATASRSEHDLPPPPVADTMTPASDLFALFELPRRFDLDVAELERRYHERARAAHPDRAAGGPADARARSTGAAIDLNRAYRVLRRPASRAEHLLALAGVSIGDNEAVDPALLVEVLELREELEAARARGDRAALERQGSAMRRREADEQARAAAGLEAAAIAEARGDTAARAAGLAQAKAACLALRYVARYLEAVAAASDDGDGEDGG